MAGSVHVSKLNLVPYAAQLPKFVPTGNGKKGKVRAVLHHAYSEPETHVTVLWGSVQDSMKVEMKTFDGSLLVKAKLVRQTPAEVWVRIPISKVAGPKS